MLDLISGRLTLWTWRSLSLLAIIAVGCAVANAEPLTFESHLFYVQFIEASYQPPQHGAGMSYMPSPEEACQGMDATEAFMVQMVDYYQSVGVTRWAWFQVNSTAGRWTSGEMGLWVDGEMTELGVTYRALGEGF